MIRQEGMRWSVIQIAVLVAVTGFIFKSFRGHLCSAAHFSKVARLRSSRHPGQAAEPLQVVLFAGEGVGEATGREVGRGPVRCVALPCPGSAALAGLPRPPRLCVRSSGRLQIPLTCHPSRFSRLISPYKPLQTHAGRMRGPPARCSGQLLTVSGEKASRLGRGPWGQGVGCFLSLFPAPGVALGTPHCTKELGRRAVTRAE